MALRTITKIADWLYSWEEKDFTPETEEKLLKISRDVSASETIFDDALEFIGKIFLRSELISVLLKYTNMYKAQVIDFYNYAEKIIREIFSQARECDCRYGGKIDEYYQIIEASTGLLENLADAVNPDSRLYGSDSVDMRISNFVAYKNNSELMRILQKGIGEHDIINFANDDSSECVFIMYSDEVYRALNINIETETLINDIAEQTGRDINDIVDELVAKFYEKTFEADLEKAIGSLTDNSKIIELIKEIIDVTGTSEFLYGYMKLTVLKAVEARAYKQYLDLRNQLSKENLDIVLESSKEIQGLDYEEINKCLADKYKESFYILKDLNIEIQETYRDMYPNNAKHQIVCNKNIGEIEEIDFPDFGDYVTENAGNLEYIGENAGGGSR